MSDKKFVMVVEQRPGLTGLLVSKDREIFASDHMIGNDEIMRKVGQNTAWQLRPVCMEMTVDDIKTHDREQVLDQFGIVDWRVWYRTGDLQAAGLLPQGE